MPKWNGFVTATRPVLPPFRRLRLWTAVFQNIGVAAFEIMATPGEANPWAVFRLTSSVIVTPMAIWEMGGGCWHERYDGAPADGSVWTEKANCTWRVLRGGSWDNAFDGVTQPIDGV